METVNYVCMCMCVSPLRRFGIIWIALPSRVFYYSAQLPSGAFLYLFHLFVEGAVRSPVSLWRVKPMLCFSIGPQRRTYLICLLPRLIRSLSMRAFDGSVSQSLVPLVARCSAPSFRWKQVCVEFHRIVLLSFCIKRFRLSAMCKCIVYGCCLRLNSNSTTDLVR